MDVCSLFGIVGEVVDVVSGYNGCLINGVLVIINGCLCQVLGFDGGNQYINIDYGLGLQFLFGILIMWFKVFDLDYNWDSYGNSFQVFFLKDFSGWDFGGQFILLVDQDGRLIFW